MKSLSSKKSFFTKRKIIVIASVIALVIAGVSAYYITKYNQEKLEQQKVLEKDRKAAKTDKSAKKNALNKDGDTQSSSNGLPEDSIEATSGQVQTSSALSISITSSSQSNGYVKSSAKTSGDGTCVFSYTKEGDKPASQQVSAIANNCSSSIPTVEIPYGLVKLNVTFYKDGKKVEASKNVTIN